MIKTKDAISIARSLIGTPYSELDCINLIKKVTKHGFISRTKTESRTKLERSMYAMSPAKAATASAGSGMALS